MTSAITQFLEAQSKFQDTVDTAIDALTTAVEGIAGDIKVQNDQITKLQSTQGALTSEDQALVDNIQARGQASGVKLTAIADQLKALDALNPPPVPVQPVG